MTHSCSGRELGVKPSPPVGDLPRQRLGLTTSQGLPYLLYLQARSSFRPNGNELGDRGGGTGRKSSSLPETETQMNGWQLVQLRPK